MRRKGAISPNGVLHVLVQMCEALRYAQQQLELGKDYFTDDEENDQGVERHLTGQELCEAARLYAMQQYGMTAPLVLQHWGIHKTGDMGNIVFNLIDIGQMKKTDNDRREDFDDLYDFDVAFRETFHLTHPNPSEGRWA